MFTYLIGWTTHDRWYYGVSIKKDREPSDLWIKYFTSSKHVNKFREQHGEPDVLLIRKQFKDAAAARTWENKVLNRLNVVSSIKWLNKTDNKAIDPDAALVGARKNRGKPKSEEHKRKLSEAAKAQHARLGHPRIGAVLSEDTKRKISEGRRGIPMSEEARMKISIASKSRVRMPHSEETKQKIRMTLLGKKNRNHYAT